MTNSINRRLVLCSAATAPLALAVPASAEPTLDFELGRRSALLQMIELLESTRDEARKTDPVLPHFAAWKAARAEWERLMDLPGNEDNDHPDSIAALDRAHAAFLKIVEAVPISFEGIAAVAEVLAAWEGIELDVNYPAAQGDPHRYAARLIGNMVAAAEVRR